MENLFISCLRITFKYLAEEPRVYFLKSLLQMEKVTQRKERGGEVEEEERVEKEAEEVVEGKGSAMGKGESLTYVPS